ncbi:MAG: tyrosine-protein phosphatase [Gemmataceae bacterium]
MADQPAAQRRSLAEMLIRGAITGVMLAIGLQAGYILGGSNFRTVLPGQAYRCAQPSASHLEQFITKHGIRTVVNLRGCCPTAAWYRDEARTTASLDVCQEDINFSATRLPSTISLRHLVEVLDRSEYPLLFHCHQGADRTGLASVMVKLLRTDASLDEALRELSVRSGHLPLGKTRHVDRFFEFYRDWLEEQGLEHSPSTFRTWATQHYCPGDGRAEITVLANLEHREGHRPRLKVQAHQSQLVQVRCRNLSEEAWVFQPGTNAGVHLWWFVHDRDERLLRCDRAGLFHAVVAPGESLDLTVPLPALPPGRHELRLDLINEQHAFFLQVGNALQVIELEVS